MRKIVADHWMPKNYLCHPSPNASTNVLRMQIYILTYAALPFTITIYLFNINSRKLDGHNRFWIEYLNKRY